MTPKRIHKILILRFSSLGDILMTTAMIRAVRAAFPHAQIDMVVREDFLALIQDNPHLDGKIGLPRRSGMAGLKALLKTLNRERYDLVYDAHRSLRTRFLMPLLEAEHKVYYDKHYGARTMALLFKYPRLTDRTRMLERFCEPLAQFGVRYDGGGPELKIKEAAREKIAAGLPKIPGEKIGVVPCAQWNGKRWAPERFREVIRNLVETTNHQILVFGGKEDGFCVEICAGFPENRVVNLQGKLSLTESCAAVSLCRYVIANDTGLMHAADSLGIPTILILGPTSAELGCLPHNELSQVLEHDLWCRPCSKNGQAPCIRGRRHCLELTQPKDVLSAVDKVWAGLGETTA